MPWRATLRIALLTALTSLWWVVALVIEGRYGLPLLSYTETIEQVASTSSATEVLRGLGYWVPYLSQRGYAEVSGAHIYLDNLPVLALQFAVVLVAVSRDCGHPLALPLLLRCDDRCRRRDRHRRVPGDRPSPRSARSSLTSPGLRDRSGAALDHACRAARAARDRVHPRCLGRRPARKSAAHGPRSRRSRRGDRDRARPVGGRRRARRSACTRAAESVPIYWEDALATPTRRPRWSASRNSRHSIRRVQLGQHLRADHLRALRRLRRRGVSRSRTAAPARPICSSHSTTGYKEAACLPPRSRPWLA